MIDPRRYGNPVLQKQPVEMHDFLQINNRSVVIAVQYLSF